MARKTISFISQVRNRIPENLSVIRSRKLEPNRRSRLLIRVRPRFVCKTFWSSNFGSNAESFYSKMKNVSTNRNVLLSITTIKHF